MGAPPGTMMKGSFAPNSERAERLQQRSDAADQEGSADEADREVGRQVERAADQESRRDRGRRHHQDVLEAEQEELAPRQDFVDGVYGLRHRASQGWAERFPLGLGEHKTFYWASKTFFCW